MTGARAAEPSLREAFAPGGAGARLLVWLSIAGFIVLGRALPPSLRVGDSIDALAHALGFAVIGYLTLRSIAPGPGHASRAWALFATAAFCACIGALDEWGQSYMVTRYASWFDWSADVLGGTLGGMAALTRSWHTGPPRVPSSEAALAGPQDPAPDAAAESA